MDTLQYSLGIEVDPDLAKKKPDTTVSLPENHGGYCLVCYDELNEDNQFSLKCGHTYCKVCWKGYLSDKVNTDFTGIDANCMQLGCNLKVGHKVYEMFLDDNESDRARYWQWMIKSFTDTSPNVRWCPNPKCDLCV